MSFHLYTDKNGKAETTEMQRRSLMRYVDELERERKVKLILDDRALLDGQSLLSKEVVNNRRDV